MQIKCTRIGRISYQCHVYYLFYHNGVASAIRVLYSTLPETLLHNTSYLHVVFVANAFNMAGSPP